MEEKLEKNKKVKRTSKDDKLINKNKSKKQTSEVNLGNESKDKITENDSIKKESTKDKITEEDSIKKDCTNEDILKDCTKDSTNDDILNDCNENVIDIKEESIDIKKESIDIKKESIDIKEESIDIKEESIDIKKESIDIKKESIDIKEESIDIKEESIDIKKESIDIKKESIDIKEETDGRSIKIKKEYKKIEEQIEEADENSILCSNLDLIKDIHNFKKETFSSTEKDENLLDVGGVIDIQIEDGNDVGDTLTAILNDSNNSSINNRSGSGEVNKNVIEFIKEDFEYFSTDENSNHQIEGGAVIRGMDDDELLEDEYFGNDGFSYDSSYDDDGDDVDDDDLNNSVWVDEESDISQSSSEGDEDYKRVGWIANSSKNGKNGKIDKNLIIKPEIIKNNKNLPNFKITNDVYKNRFLIRDLIKYKNSCYVIIDSFNIIHLTDLQFKNAKEFKINFYKISGFFIQNKDDEASDLTSNNNNNVSSNNSNERISNNSNESISKNNSNESISENISNENISNESNGNGCGRLFLYSSTSSSIYEMTGLNLKSDEKFSDIKFIEIKKKCTNATKICQGTSNTFICGDKLTCLDKNLICFKAHNMKFIDLYVYRNNYTTKRLEDKYIEGSTKGDKKGDKVITLDESNSAKGLEDKSNSDKVITLDESNSAKGLEDKSNSDKVITLDESNSAKGLEDKSNSDKVITLDESGSILIFDQNLNIILKKSLNDRFSFKNIIQWNSDKYVIITTDGLKILDLQFNILKEIFIKNDNSSHINSTKKSISFTFNENFFFYTSSLFNSSNSSSNGSGRSSFSADSGSIIRILTKELQLIDLSKIRFNKITNLFYEDDKLFVTCKQTIHMIEFSKPIEIINK